MKRKRMVLALSVILDFVAFGGGGLLMAADGKTDAAADWFIRPGLPRPVLTLPSWY
jgi:hypothetical protein